MSSGRIEKALSGFYYVNTGDAVLRCRARGKFRREGMSPLVGDRVEVQDLGGGEGVVEAILPRTNVFSRPAAANIDSYLGFNTDVYDDVSDDLLDVDITLCADLAHYHGIACSGRRLACDSSVRILFQYRIQNRV